MKRYITADALIRVPAYAITLDTLEKKSYVRYTGNLTFPSDAHSGGSKGCEEKREKGVRAVALVGRRKRRSGRNSSEIKMTVQQYCLRWNNHQPNFISVFSSLLNSQSLVDVTLAAEGTHLQAHKVVLSACSSYFQVMVDFMYHGEVNVSQEQLPCILKTAEMLKIKGLTEIPVDQSAATRCQSKLPHDGQRIRHGDESGDGPIFDGQYYKRSDDAPTATPSATATAKVQRRSRPQHTGGTVARDSGTGIQWNVLEHPGYGNYSPATTTTTIVSNTSGTQFTTHNTNDNVASMKPPTPDNGGVLAQEPHPQGQAGEPFYHHVHKRKRSINPQGDQNFMRALEAVRFGGIGFCKAARMYGVNNRTLWLEYKKRGYPNFRLSIKNRHRLQMQKQEAEAAGQEHIEQHVKVEEPKALTCTISHPIALITGNVFEGKHMELKHMLPRDKFFDVAENPGETINFSSLNLEQI
ncbi:unnamed protein product [Callosobruchus maculatus]|uniref:Uncharacterized protein n=1 Tax=Callosobruchus maculatus TaxID=64391 RepID=A0A653C3H1_CALMS|nr:unnamed protein product [Callosobruchus maculatus]